MTAHDAMRRIDSLASHVWMVRTFLKHSEEGEEDEDLQAIFRELYDALHALGPALQAGDAEAYLKMARKKLPKLQRAVADYAALQPRLSTHTNFQMARVSLTTAVADMAAVLAEAP